ncbi:hypothetical protein HPP92_019509 [Vanilla planifolia]|uniref:Uncharacterized protein n=1 Tax=Vanilla planifolia TaxID=51239 RepID=A0A835Q6X6_VANPL|nr:hypothetical protein HPP92_019509 [Vanilla planifolia]
MEGESGLKANGEGSHQRDKQKEAKGESAQKPCVGVVFVKTAQESDHLSSFRCHFDASPPFYIPKRANEAPLIGYLAWRNLLTFLPTSSKARRRRKREIPDPPLSTFIPFSSF